jgi:hypothetical protein
VVEGVAEGGITQGDVERLLPGLHGRVRHLRGEKELLHATLEEIW